MALLQEHTSYIKHLEEELKKAQDALRVACAKMEKTQGEYTSQKGRTTYLNLYCQNIIKTNELAKEVIYSINTNTGLAQRAAKIGKLVTIAAKILIINAEKLACGVRDLEICIDRLLEEIKGMNPPPTDGSPILKAIQNLKTSIDASLVAALDSLPKIMKFYQLSEVLSEYLGDENQTHGLTKDLFDLLKIIDISLDSSSKIKFPREGCPQDYYDYTKNEHSQAKEVLKDLIEKLNYDVQIKGEKQAKKDAIQKSKDAAVTASTC